MEFARRLIRLTLTTAAALIVLWAFIWVATRPLRLAAERKGQIELTVMHWAGGGGPAEESIVQGIIQNFENSHPGIKVKRINPGDAATFYTKLQTMSAAGVAPDVFYLGNERVAIFSSLGMLEEIQPLCDADRAAGKPTLALDDFYPATLDTFRFDGKSTGQGTLYGVPKDFTTIGFYYNKDLFQRAGVPFPSDDWTWDDFESAARAIGKLELPSREKCIGAHISIWPAMMRVYLWTHGVDITNDDFSKINYDDPAVIAAFERFHRWRFEEKSARIVTSGDQQITVEDSILQAGNIGMAGPYGRWVVPTYRNITKFDWDFAPMPRGKVQTNAVFTVAWAISKQSKHKPEAWELVKNLCGPLGQEQTARSGLAIPTMRSVAEGPAFNDPNEKPDRDRSYLRAAEYARAMRWPVTQKFEARLGARLQEALRSNTKTVPQALKAFSDDWGYETTTPLARTDFPPVAWLQIIIAIALISLAASAAMLIWWLRNPLGRIEGREERSGFAFISPWALGFITLTAFPVIMSLILAFTKWNGVTTLENARWVGLANLRQLLFADEQFTNSLRVTLYYAVLAVPSSQLFALFAAMLMNHDFKGIGFFRAAWYLPSVLAGVGVAVLWRWIFDGDHGLLNAVLRPAAEIVQTSPPHWLSRDAAYWGAPAFAIMGLWTIGGSMMIYLAGLKGISPDLYEAAAIDGAPAWRRMTTVTLPMLSPVIFFNVIMAIIASFQVFVQSYVMTSGGPGDATRFYVLYLFNQAFDFNEMGYASMMAWILLVITLVLTLIVIRGSRRLVYYEALKP